MLEISRADWRADEAHAHALSPDEAADPSIWNDFWHFDRLSSFENEGETNYQREIAADWRRFFGSLPRHASILDLCTGNGAVAALAAEAGRAGNKAFRVSAVDSADINPCLYVSRKRDDLALIDFRPRVRIETLPWPAASFDAVVSQFGVEYSDLSRSISEVVRVIAPGGRVRLSLHAAEGHVVDRSRRSIADIDLLLHGADLAGKALACLRSIAAVERRMDRSVEALAASQADTDAFAAALRQVARLIPEAADADLLRNAGKMLVGIFEGRRGQDLARSIGWVEGIRTEWRNHRARLAAQIDAAVTREMRESLAERLRQLGANRVEHRDQSGAEGLLAHCIEARF